MEKLILYNYFRSSTSYRARIALHWKNLDFEYRPVHLLNDGGDQNKPAYRAINTQGEVPTLIHGERVIGQSMAIIEYLDEVFPQNAVFPSETYSRALVRQVCENFNSFMHPLGNLKVLQYLEKNHGYDQAQKEQWVQHWVHQGLSATEKFLEKHAGQFAFGDQVTAADMFIVPQLFTAKRFLLDTSIYKILTRIEKNCEGLKAFQAAHPLCQVDTPQT